MFLLKDTTQWRWWGSSMRPFGLQVKHSTTEPLRSLLKRNGSTEVPLTTAYVETYLSINGSNASFMFLNIMSLLSGWLNMIWPRHFMSGVWNKEYRLTNSVLQIFRFLVLVSKQNCLCNLSKGHLGGNFDEIFWVWASSSGDVELRFFLFLVLVSFFAQQSHRGQSSLTICHLA